jgi:hypothetical protein
VADRTDGKYYRSARSRKAAYWFGAVAASGRYAKEGSLSRSVKGPIEQSFSIGGEVCQPEYPAIGRDRAQRLPAAACHGPYLYGPLLRRQRSSGEGGNEAGAFFQRG